MKLFYSISLVLFLFSCGSSKSNVNSNQTSITKTDCSEEIKEYVHNNQGLITSSTERYSVGNISKQNDGSYSVQLRWDSGELNGRTFKKQFFVDSSCKVMKIK